MNEAQDLEKEQRLVCSCGRGSEPCPVVVDLMRRALEDAATMTPEEREARVQRLRDHLQIGPKSDARSLLTFAESTAIQQMATAKQPQPGQKREWDTTLIQVLA